MANREAAAMRVAKKLTAVRATLSGDEAAILDEIVTQARLVDYGESEMVAHAMAPAEKAAQAFEFKVLGRATNSVEYAVEMIAEH
jgi:hypothetical protein